MNRPSRFERRDGQVSGLQPFEIDLVGPFDIVVSPVI